MRRWVRDDQGAVAVIVAIFLVVLLGFAAVVIDAGYLYAVRRQLQAAADGAALAGCQQLILDASDEQIFDVARLYAEGADYNAVKPADGCVMATGAPDFEIGDNYVKVSVKKDVSLWFARVLGFEEKTVYAQSKAKIGYLTGLKGVVPWAVPTLRASRVSVRLGGGAVYDLVKNTETGEWQGPVPVPTGAAANLVLTVVASNNQTAYPDGTSDYPNGVPETIDNAGIVSVVASGTPVSDVYLEKPFVTAGEDTSVTVFVRASGLPRVTLDRTTKDMVLVSGDLYRCSMPVPTGVDELHRSFPVSVQVGAYKLDPAATLVVRRSTYPVKDVVLTPAVQRVGTTGAAVNVTVRLNDYVYGRRYSLKVIGGDAEVGNFCALDLSTVRHTPNWRHPMDPAEYDVNTDPDYRSPAYTHYLETSFPFVIHIGDTIWTEPGNMGEPTEKALDIRFDDEGSAMTFEEWEDADKPGTKRVVYVPVVEKLQEVTGSTPVRVVSLAAFYVEPDSSAKKDVISGRFIEFVAPADAISDTPPDAMYHLETGHLVPMDY